MLSPTSPSPMGTYPPEDVTFLLTDISGRVREQSTEERERLIQSGVHYSEMLPIEYEPTPRYMDLFESSLGSEAQWVARATGVVAERCLKLRGKELVLVSLARAGTPVGVLMRRYLRLRHQLDVPHYAISIIRGKGFDHNALRWLTARYPASALLFVDGWTGKGAITKELLRAAEEYETQQGVTLNPDLAVLADPGYCANILGTHDDRLVPSACLNSTVSGLVSRTFHRPDVITDSDFHGAVFYEHLREQDVSLRFIEAMCDAMPSEFSAVDKAVAGEPLRVDRPSWAGWESIGHIAAHHGIDDLNLIKPGVGETTRVLLRRIPWKILIHPDRVEQLSHVLQLAKERDVGVETWPDMSYACCGVIRPL